MEIVRRRHHGRMPNLTPLVDVLFLLVVFFMLTTSFARTESMELTLPSLGAAAVSGAAPIYIGVFVGGAVSLGPEEMPFPEVMERLGVLLAQDPDGKIMLVATRGASVQEVVTVMDRIQAIGGQFVSVAYYE